jgi:hypothetical protein
MFQHLPKAGTFVLACLSVIALVTAIYWPVHAAGFVWDDYKFLLDSGWMTDRSYWPHLIAHGFPEWASYYRPLGVSLYIAETNLSDFRPMPMHLLSLGIHLANVALVGLLARRLLQLRAPEAEDSLEDVALPSVAMLIYGVHPALVEPVVWISAQFDMLTTVFVLAGLFLNLHVRNRLQRAAGVALCFLLAALSKEAALSFPFMLAVLDWMIAPEGSAHSKQTTRGRLAFVISRQWPVYTTTFAAGLAYLALRKWGIGFLVNPSANATLSFWPYLQTVSYTYFAYWKLILWPMGDLSPIRAVDASAFATVSARLIATDFAAATITLVGLWQLWKRTPAGGLIASVTAALLPVLHLIPIDFSASLYHNRYAMTAVAMGCAFLPFSWHAMRQRCSARPLALSAALVVTAWLLLAVVNTRQCIPLWSNNVSLWQWVLAENPDNVEARQSLLAAYVRAGNLTRAQPLADEMMQDEQMRACLGCMLNVAALRLDLRDAEGAAASLGQAKRDMDRSATLRHGYLGTYILLSGQLGELRNDDVEAEEAYRAAIAFNPQLAEARLRLALVLARTHRLEEAGHQYATALSLYLPAERAQLRRQFDPLLAIPRASGAPSQPHQRATPALE